MIKKCKLREYKSKNELPTNDYHFMIIYNCKTQIFNVKFSVFFLIIVENKKHGKLWKEDTYRIKVSCLFNDISGHDNLTESAGGHFL